MYFFSYNKLKFPNLNWIAWLEFCFEKDWQRKCDISPFSPVQMNNFCRYPLSVFTFLHDSLFLIEEESQQKLICDFYVSSCCSLTFMSLPGSFWRVNLSLNDFIVLWCSLFVQYRNPVRKGKKRIGQRKMLCLRGQKESPYYYNYCQMNKILQKQWEQTAKHFSATGKKKK